MLQALALLLLSSIPLAAQNVSATINGTVRDASGAVMPKAKVVITNDATGAPRQALSGADGNFVFPDMLAGSYSLMVEMKGFRTLRQKDIRVTASQIRALGDLKLSVGEVAETITVEDSVAPVELGSGERSGVITQDELQNTAIRGRDYLDMLRLLPGVVDESEGREAPGPDGIRNLYINGARENQKNVTVDGVTSMDSGSNSTVHSAPTLNTIAEVKVLTSNYQAEYGRAMGGTIIVTTRGGSRSYHGTATWTHRHEQFNANNFFNNQKSLAKAPYRFNIVGWSVGGPIIPVNRSHAKFFFFASQEYMAQKVNYNPQSVRMPTGLERTGDFSQTLDLNRNRLVVYDPLTTQPFANNMIPKDRFHKTGQAILNMFPLPNFVDPVASRAVQWNYVTEVAGSYPRRQEMVRFDIAPHSRWQAYMRYTQDFDEQHPTYGVWINGGVNYDLTPLTFRQPGRGMTFNFSRAVGTTWFVQTMFGYSMNRLTSVPDQPERISKKALGIDLPQWRPDLNPGGFIPNMTFGVPGTSPNPSMNNSMPYKNVNHIFSVTQNFSKIHRSHTIRMGAYVERTRKDQLQGTPTRGSISFGDDSNNPLRTRYGYASALLGIMTNYSEATSKPYGLYRFTNLEWYIQDNWRVSRRLTLDYGLRFYHNMPQYEARDQLAAFVPALYNLANAPVLITSARNAAGARVGVNPVNGQQFNVAFIGTFAPGYGNPSEGMVTSGSKGFPKGLYSSPNLMLGPRFGFAYDPIGKGRTAIRGGFGLFFDRVQGNPTMNMLSNPPTSFSPTLYYSTIEELAASANSALFAPSTISHSLYGSGTMPQSYQWSIGVQHAIGKYTRFDVSYVGNAGRHLLWQRNINAVPIGAQFLNLHPENRDATTNQVFANNFLRPYRGYGDILEYEFGGTSSYNSLQSTFSTRTRGGLEFRSSYTFAKTLGSAASDTSSVTPFFAPRDWNYGPLSYNRTHVLTMMPNWRMPKGWLPANPYLRKPMANWMVFATAQFSTGQPYRPGFSTVDGQNFTGTPSQGATMLRLPDDSFARPCATRVAGAIESPCWGNAGPGIMTRPGVNNWDARVTRRFNLFSERRTLDFRAEAFNLLNHTQMSGLDTTARFDAIGNQINGQFLQPNSARRARFLSFGVQLNF
ncbi:MAG: carboxypeptidase regulatory-like domain-containing protein [Candidatus Solibacter usitatus]|nr:carboxypeptidase regulatory-like domain-containing protein [Candidatus Solibacter usitatus]